MGVDVAVAVVQHQGTELLPDGRTARLPGPQHLQAAGFQGFGQLGSLRGLARAVAAFKRNKKPGALDSHLTSLPIPADIHRLDAAPLLPQHT